MTIKELARHAGLGTTIMKYMHLSPSAKGDGIAALRLFGEHDESFDDPFSVVERAMPHKMPHPVPGRQRSGRDWRL